MLRNIVASLLPAVLLASVASAERPATIALSSSAADPQLKWGPCPAFMPKGCGLAVLQGDPAKANADVFLRVPGGARIASHWHTSAERMVLISGEMQVAYEGQKPTTLKPGMYAYGPAKLAHSASCATGESCVLFIAFEEPVDAVPADGGSK